MYKRKWKPAMITQFTCFANLQRTFHQIRDQNREDEYTDKMINKQTVSTPSILYGESKPPRYKDFPTIDAEKDFVIEDVSIIPKN